MIKKGEEAVAAQNLNEAIQHFLGALICDANLAGELGPRIQDVFVKIEEQKKAEEAQRKEAQKQTRIAQQQREEANKQRKAAEEEALKARIAQLSTEARLYQDIDPLRGFRLAERGYHIALENELPTNDFEKVILNTVYNGIFHLNDQGSFVEEKVIHEYNRTGHDLKLEEIDIEKGEAKVVEKDKSGEIINEYPIQLDYGEWGDYYSLSNTNVSFTDNEQFIITKQLLSGDGGDSKYYLWERGVDSIPIYSADISFFNRWDFLFDQKGDNIIAANDERGYRRIHLRRGYHGRFEEKQHYLDFGHLTSALEISSSGRYLAAGSETGEVKIFDLDSPWTSSPLIEFIAHPNQPITAITFCNEEQNIKTTSSQSTKYWPIKKPKLYYKASNIFEKIGVEDISYIDFKDSRFTLDGIKQVVSFNDLVLNNKGLYTIDGAPLLITNYSNEDREGYMGFAGVFSDDGHYIGVDIDFGGDCYIYPIKPELILSLINEEKALGDLAPVELEDWSNFQTTITNPE
jgi:WD40 repeat protein